jgi:hypothetical protein
MHHYLVIDLLDGQIVVVIDMVQAPLIPQPQILHYMLNGHHPLLAEGEQYIFALMANGNYQLAEKGGG